MMQDEVIQIEDTSAEEKSREERKANGRLIAVIVALLLIFIAIYHAWIRKTAVLAGVLVPALIMILYGGWVVFLAKRDKRRRLLLARQMGENARREILAKQQLNAKSSCKDNKEIHTVAKISESEKKTSRKSKKSEVSRALPTSQIRRKWRDKPSFRHRIFRQNAQTEVLIKSRQECTPLCRTFSAPP